MAASKSPKKGKPKKTKEASAEAKKLSALDAAAKVLAETGQPKDTCQANSEPKQRRGYWSRSRARERPGPRCYAVD